MLALASFILSPEESPTHLLHLSHVEIRFSDTTILRRVILKGKIFRMVTSRPSRVDNPTYSYATAEQLSGVGTLSEGRHNVQYGSHSIDFLFRNHVADTLVITFHGAALRTVQLPWFTGNGILDGARTKWVAFSDPSLQLNEDLAISWYAGSQGQPDLQIFLAKVLEIVIEKTGTRNVIFIGGSGGGFAALEMSRRFAGSLVIPMNPQTSISRYYERFVKDYLSLAWDTESLTDRSLRSVTHDLVDSYDPSHLNTIAYIQNSRDKFHITQHQIPFFNAMSDSNKLWLLKDSWGNVKNSGHVIPPKDEVKSLLSKACEAEGNWEDLLLDCSFIKN